MWWLISVVYVAVGLLRFRSKFSSILKTMDRMNQQRHDEAMHEYSAYCRRCGKKGCDWKDHAPKRRTVDTEDRFGAIFWAVLEGLFWLPLFLARVFWKGLFPKGVLAETSKERKARLKKEKAAEEEFLLKQAKELGLM